MLESFSTRGGLRGCLPGMSSGLVEKFRKLNPNCIDFTGTYSCGKSLVSNIRKGVKLRLSFSQTLHRIVHGDTALQGRCALRALIQRYHCNHCRGITAEVSHMCSGTSSNISNFFTSQCDEYILVTYVGLSSTYILWKGKKPCGTPLLLQKSTPNPICLCGIMFFWFPHSGTLILIPRMWFGTGRKDRQGREDSHYLLL